MIAYFNGEFVAKNQISISPDDRGFLFADGLYEVIRAYRGQLFRTKDHIDRLNFGASQLCFSQTEFSYLEQIAQQLLEKNNLEEDATIYIQVTRGAAPRAHAFPDPPCELTVYASAAPFDPLKTQGNKKNGITVITVPDQRWARCDIKTIGLTANVLANQKAVEHGAKEALFIRDNTVLEGTHSNFMAVIDKTLVTAPESHQILHGITRKVVLELAADKGIPVNEAPIAISKTNQITESFITGTTTEITPVVSIDGKPVGNGAPGPVTRMLQNAFSAYILG